MPDTRGTVGRQRDQATEGGSWLDPRSHRATGPPARASRDPNPGLIVSPRVFGTSQWVELPEGFVVSQVEEAAANDGVPRRHRLRLRRHRDGQAVGVPAAAAWAAGPDGRGLPGQCLRGAICRHFWRHALVTTIEGCIRSFLGAWREASTNPVRDREASCAWRQDATSRRCPTARTSAWRKPQPVPASVGARWASVGARPPASGRAGPAPTPAASGPAGVGARRAAPASVEAARIGTGRARRARRSPRRAAATDG